MIARHEELSPREQQRLRARRRRAARTVVLSIGFVGAMIGSLAALGERAADGAEKESQTARQTPVREPEAAPERADIVDRNGMPLARAIPTFELYLNGRWLETEDERVEAVQALRGLFPRIDEESIRAALATDGDRLVARPLTPREAQDAHNLGIPGLSLQPRVDRLYPAGNLTAHVVGWTNIDGGGVAGIEAVLDQRLKNGGPPLELTLDLRVQTALHDALLGQMQETGAQAAAGIVMDVRTGAVRGLVSLPDFDPHSPPAPPAAGDAKAQERSPLFHRAVAGGYELGSVMKTVTWALALETGAADMLSVYDASQPLAIGRDTISDDHPMGAHVSFRRAFAKSSNIVAAKLALAAGPAAQARFIKTLGLMKPTGIEQISARKVAGRWPDEGTELGTATAAFGHGLAITPMHLAAAGASLVNGGVKVRPTLLPADPSAPPAMTRVVSPETSKKMTELLRAVVTEGTGSRADIPGLEIGGKTGTADKPGPSGYAEDKVIASFLAVFPTSKPRYVVVVTLDEPELERAGERLRGAGLTAAPAARAVIERVSPLLGVVAGL